MLRDTESACIAPLYSVDSQATSPAQKRALYSQKKITFPEALDMLGARLFTNAVEKKSLIPLYDNQIDISLKTLDLSKEQREISQTIENQQFVLLEGVTGSGKTEVYLQWIHHLIHKKQILILTPTINLAEQTAKRIKDTLGFPAFCWHNLTTKSTKDIIWDAVLAGMPLIIVGARSALFLPFQNLGAIILDEEHDNASYKQESSPIYHARSAGFLLSQAHKCPLLYASATPSLETRHASQEKPFCHVKLTTSFYKSKNTTTIADLRLYPPTDSRDFLSPPLCAAISETLNHKKQSLIFMNRRGFSPLTLCTHCGLRITCHQCDTFLSYHKRKKLLICHYCTTKTPLPSHCPHCASGSLIFFGPAIERIAEEVAEKFPDAHVSTLSSDMFASARTLQNTINLIKENKTDIIVSTQMLTNGLDFPFLSLVGFVDAELGRSFHDIRATEHAYQTLVQVSGRCGRNPEGGRIIIQTFTPNDPILSSIINNNNSAFINNELTERHKHQLPPYHKLAIVRITGKNKRQIESWSTHCLKLCPHHKDVTVLGPSESPIALIENKHRWFFLVRTQRGSLLRAFLKKWIELTGEAPQAITMHVDLEPTFFL